MSARSRARRPRGQVLVIFAMSITALFAFAGLAFDIGRFYGERRFLQNSSDAAALAAANALVRGLSDSAADTEARSVLTRNFLSAPNGITPPLPPATPVYEAGHAGDPRYLAEGILITGTDVRVAVRNNINYTFGRAIGLSSNTVGAKSRVKLRGHLLPIAVRHYVYPPGPKAGAAAPCPDDQTKWMDFFSTANTACLGTQSNTALRVSPSAGAAFNSANPGDDPVNHGPIVAILGQGAQANNPADFRGYIVLDVRNFSTSTSEVYYNGVTSGTNANTLKAFEAEWILDGGYPGPGFPPVTSPPDPNDQVMTMSGNSTGIALDSMLQRFRPGQHILVAVYNGNVNAVPDFSMAQPAQLTVNATGTVVNAGSFQVSRNASFAGTVALTALADAADPTGPSATGRINVPAITLTPNPVTPTTTGTSITIGNVITAAAPVGIFPIFIQGTSSSPYLTTKVVPVTVKVGTVTRDFTITSNAQTATPASAGGSVSFTLTLVNAPVANTNFGGAVTLSVDNPRPAGVGTITFSPATVTPSRTGSSTTLTINTGSMAPGSYTFMVRARGTNADATPRPVTHIIPLQVDIPPVLTGNSGVYVDIEGFAVMRITSLDVNTVFAYAVTPVVADQNDPRLRLGQVPRLVPWN